MPESEAANIAANPENDEVVTPDVSSNETTSQSNVEIAIGTTDESPTDTIAVITESVIQNQSEEALRIGTQEANIINNIDRQEIKNHNIFQLFSFDEFIRYIKRYGIVTLMVLMVAGIAYYFGMKQFRYYQNTVSVMNAVTAFKEENPDFKIQESTMTGTNTGAIAHNTKKNVSSANRTVNAKRFEIKAMNGLYSIGDNTRLVLNKISVSFTDVKTNKQLCVKNSIIANQELTPNMGMGGGPDGDIINVTTETLTQIKDASNILSAPIRVTTPDMLYVTIPFDLSDGANVDANYVISYEFSNLDNHETVTNSSSGRILTSMTNLDFNDLRDRTDYDFYHLLDFNYPNDTSVYAYQGLSIHLGKNEKIVKYFNDGEFPDDQEREDAIEKDVTIRRVFDEPRMLSLYKAIALHDRANEKYYLLRKIHVDGDGTVETVDMSASQSGCISEKGELFEQNEVSKFEFESIIKILYPSYGFDPTNISSVYFLPGSQNYKLVLRDSTKTERVVHIDSTDGQMSFYDSASFISYDKNRNTVTWTADGTEKVTIETNIDTGVTRTIRKESSPAGLTSAITSHTNSPRQYTVSTEKTYFYDTIGGTPRKGYLIKGQMVTVDESRVSGGFGYAEYTDKGRKTIGYLLISTLSKN